MYSTWEPTNNISEKKIQEDGPRPDLGLGFGGVWRDFWKIEHLLCC